MENHIEPGFNRTGAQSSSLTAHSMQLYADEQWPHARPIPHGVPDGKAIAGVRSDYVIEADRVGSVPMPGAMTSALKTMMSRLTGKRPEVLVDKLGARLAFERTGVRLYQALIDKASALQGQAALPFTIGELQSIRNDELEHMHLLASALDSLGADPTAQTPSADVVGVTSMGVMQVLTDPRTTMAHCLEAILTAELTDNAGWELLIAVIDSGGDDELLPEFRRALQNEARHLAQIRGWLRAIVIDEAT